MGIYPPLPRVGCRFPAVLSRDYVVERSSQICAWRKHHRPDEGRREAGELYGDMGNGD